MNFIKKEISRENLEKMKRLHSLMNGLKLPRLN